MYKLITTQSDLLSHIIFSSTDTYSIDDVFINHVYTHLYIIIHVNVILVNMLGLMLLPMYIL